MPVIPTYQRGVPVDLTPPTVRATPEAFGAGAAEGLGALGQATTQTGMAMRERADRDSWLLARETLADFQLQKTQELNQARLNAPNDPRGFTDQFMSGFEKDSIPLINAMPEGRAKLHFMVGMKELRNQFYDTAASFEAGRRSDFKLQSAYQYGQTQAATVLHDPTSFSEAMQNIDAYGQDLHGFVEAKDIERFKLKSKADVAETDLKSWGSENPEEAISRIDNGTYDKFLPADYLAAERARLQKEHEKVSVYDSKLAQENLDAQVRSISLTGNAPDNSMPKDQIVAAVAGPDVEKQKLVALQYDKEIESARLDFTDHQHFTGRSAEERAAYFAMRKANIAEGQGPLTATDRDEQLKKAEKASANDLEAMQKDPAIYFTASDPHVREAYLQATQSKDPSQFKQYADLLVSAQAAAGFRPEQVRLLPTDRAISDVQDLESKATAPESIVQKMKALRTFYGEDNFGKIVQQYQGLPTSARMDPRYEAILLNLDEPWVNRLVQVLRDDPKDVAKMFPTDKAHDAVKNGLRATPEVQKLIASGASEVQLEHYLAAGQAYAESLTLHGYDGVKIAASDLFGSKYEYQKQPVGQLAIPKSGLTDNQVRNVKDSLDNLKEVVANQPLSHFNDAQIKALFPWAANEQERKSLLSDQIKKYGVWKNVGSDRAELHIVDPATGADAKLIPPADQINPIPGGHRFDLPALAEMNFDELKNMSWPMSEDNQRWFLRRGFSGKDTVHGAIGPVLLPAFGSRDWQKVSGSIDYEKSFSVGSKAAAAGYIKAKRTLKGE